MTQPSVFRCRMKIKWDDNLWPLYITMKYSMYEKQTKKKRKQNRRHWHQDNFTVYANTVVNPLNIETRWIHLLINSYYFIHCSTDKRGIVPVEVLLLPILKHSSSNISTLNIVINYIFVIAKFCCIFFLIRVSYQLVCSFQISWNIG